MCESWDAVRQDLQAGDIANLRALSDSARCKFLTAVILKILVLWDVRVCRCVSGFRRFEDLSCLCVYLAVVLVAGVLEMLIHDFSPKILETLAQQCSVTSQKTWYLYYHFSV